MVRSNDEGSGAVRDDGYAVLHPGALRDRTASYESAERAGGVRGILRTDGAAIRVEVAGLGRFAQSGIESKRVKGHFLGESPPPKPKSALRFGTISTFFA